MISIVIPSRNEPYLNKTVEDLLAKAEGEIEIITVLDGYWEAPIDDPRVKVIHRGQALGMRAGINAAVAIAQGKYILKTDAHCMFDQGYDLKLAAECEANWVVVPRRKRLDPATWSLIEGKPDVDYMKLDGMKGVLWESKNRDPQLKKILIDDLMTAQGSCWFMHRRYFYELELMDEKTYTSFWNEFQEIGLKAWLSGGRVVVNKKTWYAHWHKDKRGYKLDEASTLQEFYWRKATLPIEWLYQKFT